MPSIDDFKKAVFMGDSLTVGMGQNVKDITNEERNIRLLKQAMEEYIRGKVPTIKVILIEDFIKALDMILLRPKEKPKRGRRKKTEETEIA